MGAVDMVLACREEQTEHRRMLQKLAVVIVRNHLKMMLMSLDQLDFPDSRRHKG